MPNRYAQAHSRVPRLKDAIADASASLVAQFGEGPLDLVVAFFGGYPANEMDDHLPEIKALTGGATVLGCSSVAVIGGDQELENETAVSMWGARFSDADVVPMHLQYHRAVDGGAVVGWPDDDDFEESWQADSFLMLLGEPFEFPADILLERMNEDRPGTKMIGGMASGGDQPGEDRLLLNDTVYPAGAVAVRISGVPMTTVVSQGCRPIGEPMVVTASERNIIEQLGGKSALSQLRSLFGELPTRDQRLVQGGLQVGRVINEYQAKFSYGDFLIRNVVGIDSEMESISIGDYVQTGQTVQFHVRDAESASAELEQMLGQLVDQDFKAGLLFTCNGRGLNLFPEPNHDVAIVQSTVGPIALAGFFAAGEIGPVSERNFVHGFTASLVLFQ